MTNNLIHKTFRLSRYGSVGISAIDNDLADPCVGKDDLFVVGWDKSGKEIFRHDSGYPLGRTLFDSYVTGNIRLFVRVIKIINLDPQVKAELKQYLDSQLFKSNKKPSLKIVEKENAI